MAVCGCSALRSTENEHFVKSHVTKGHFPVACNWPVVGRLSLLRYKNNNISVTSGRSECEECEKLSFFLAGAEDECVQETGDIMGTLSEKELLIKEGWAHLSSQ